MDIGLIKYQVESLQGVSSETDLFLKTLDALAKNLYSDAMENHCYRLELQRVSRLMSELGDLLSQSASGDYGAQVSNYFELLESLDPSESKAGRASLKDISRSLLAKSAFFENHTKTVKPFKGRPPNLNRDEFLDWVLKAFCASYGRWPKQTRNGPDLETVIAVLRDSRIFIEDYEKLIKARIRELNKTKFNWPVVFGWVQ